MVGDVTIVTFLGTFSVGAQYSLPPIGEDKMRCWTGTRIRTGFTTSSMCGREVGSSLWYGLGFVWFLVRLAFAILFGLLDLVLILSFSTAGVFDVLAGVTARNITLGLFALIGIWLIILFFRQ